jgi:hypothetical protein
VLLLNNGRMLQGTVTEEGTEVVLRQNGGEIRFKKLDVERTFASIAEVYQYKLTQLPERDPEEHMKLARWCLGQNMRDEAKAELLAVLALSPKSNQARAMLGSIEADESRAGQTKRDPSVARASAEVVERDSGSSRPQSMVDPSLLNRAQRELGISGLPVIFDLPPAVAVKRAEQFSKNIHPLLQMTCAKCHNEQYSGRFQLVEVKNRRGLTGTVLRANLDATLQLINPENPAGSELLSSVLLPHGNGQSRRPVFSGSNDPRFQVLSAWVNSLHATKGAGEGIAQSRFGGRDDPAGPGFASDRNPIPLPFSPTPNSSASGPAAPAPDFSARRLDPRFVDPGAIPGTRYVPGRGMVPEQDAPSPGEFPLPYMLGGPKPALQGSASGAGVLGAKAGQSPLPASQPSLPLRPTPESPAGKEDDNATDSDSKAEAKPSKKPVTIDPGLLERALKSRMGAR